MLKILENVSKRKKTLGGKMVKSRIHAEFMVYNIGAVKHSFTEPEETDKQ